jgi:Zn-finger nucleic acid-binding protein
MMQCPQCDVATHEVTARANPGTLILLDQCGKCGGIWCDKWELFPVDPDEAERVEAGDAVDQSLLAAPAAVARRSLYCPRCTSPLMRCKDPALPADLLLERCLRCDGIWLNRGEMKRFKRHQRKIRLDKMGADALIQKIPEICENPKSWIVKGTQGMMAYPRMVDASSENVKPSLRGALVTILQALVRLAIGI